MTGQSQSIINNNYLQNQDTAKAELQNDRTDAQNLQSAPDTNDQDKVTLSETALSQANGSAQNDTSGASSLIAGPSGTTGYALVNKILNMLNSMTNGASGSNAASDISNVHALSYSKVASLLS